MLFRSENVQNRRAGKQEKVQNKSGENPDTALNSQEQIKCSRKIAQSSQEKAEIRKPGEENETDYYQ